mmetsp:Transcript_5820/g.12487  ORF Transcript_5820/g.12487 Transcript_5820/m.12487 type:complete len:362 (+) Transcript_5820:68-1153(+)
MKLTIAFTGAAAAPLKCGVASARFNACASCLDAVLSTGKVDFWWNWDTQTKVDYTALSPANQAKANETFVPMIWGQVLPDGDWDFLSKGTHIMGFNEPDQYGPSCDGDWNPPAYGCSAGEWRAATSSGWAPLFDPSAGSAGDPHAATYWQDAINKLAAKTGGPRQVVSPSMAQVAEPGASCIGVDPSVADNPKYCYGWLKAFKTATLALDCTDFQGKTTNCWDVIDAIQIHAYARTAAEVKEKIKGYETIFQEDFDGTNGRKKKTLWLTEVAMGSNNATEITGFVDDLMNEKDGLNNRETFGFVEKVSWFSDYSFDSFKVGTYVPHENEVWSSTLFFPYGQLSPVGERFFSHCGSTSSVMI